MDKNNNGTATEQGEQKPEDKPQGQQALTPDTDKAKGSVPYSRFQEVVEQRNGLESTINSLVAGLINELPENMRDIVPNLPPAEKAEWIRNAKMRGLFDSKGIKVTDSPGAKKPGGKTQIDLDSLTPMQKLQQGFGKGK